MTLRDTLNDEKWLRRSGFHTRHAFAGIRTPTYEQRTKGLFDTGVSGSYVEGRLLTGGHAAGAEARGVLAMSAGDTPCSSEKLVANASENPGRCSL